VHFRSILVATCVCVLMSVSITTSVQAASPQKRAKIIKMMEISGGFAVADAMMRSVSDVIINTLSEREGKPVSKKLVTKMQDATSTLMRKHFGSYLDRLIPLYDNTFGEEEIDVILAFYTSPTGRKMVKNLPQLMAGGQVVAQQWMELLQPELNSAIQSVVEEFLRENGGTLAG